MNIKDILQLRRKDIHGDFLLYIREKTHRTKRESTPIQVAVTSDVRNIIRKYGNITLDMDDYIFPHLYKGISPEEEYRIVQNFTHLINRHLKRVAVSLDIAPKFLTTYAARHSFSTILKRSGVSTEMISELLGHSSVAVTKNYLDSFESEAVKTATSALTDFSNIAIK